MKYRIRIVALLAGVGLCAVAYGQFRDIGYEIGVGGGVSMESHGWESNALFSDTKAYHRGAHFRLSLARPVSDRFQAELGFAYSELRARDVYTTVAPLDFRIKFSPVYSRKVVPYVFAGLGWLYYRYLDRPEHVDSDSISKAWIMFVPMGGGAQIRLDEHFWLEGTGTFHYTRSRDLTPEAVDKWERDSYWTALLGLRFSGGARNKDTDGDGLLNKEEKRLGTNPKNPDTDGDGLNDGEEHLTYLTNPLVADTDGDGLSDGAEVKTHNTDPLKPDTDGDGLTDGSEVNTHLTSPSAADTDGDGLSDGAEVIQYLTDPLKADTDGDSLIDGAEVTQYLTDPLKADTDGDGLSDGAEVAQYHTDPLKADTDGGSVNDNIEVERGSNPLDPADDVPQIEEVIHKPIVLPAILFESDKAVIKPESEAVLIQAYNTLMENAEIEVEIGGHTDAIGSDAANDRLSQRRADSVRQWLVNKGVAPNRLRSVGYGESRPIATNETEEGRALNRRIEFTRTK
jgi:outer membrane protein OmpA-like peptidoglycan-associated protein